MNLSLLSLTVSFLLASSVAVVRADEEAFGAFAEGLTHEQMNERIRLAKDAAQQGDSALDNMEFRGFGDFDEDFSEENGDFSSWDDEDSEEDL